MATFYKGAGPGTYWWLTDPRTAGGFVCPPGRPASAEAVVSHITVSSHPSPYLSFTAPFAVAAEYAQIGPRGPATSTMPGYVYEIDTSIISLPLVDPVAEISSAHSVTGVGHLPTHHDGGSELILGIAAPSIHGPALAAHPRRPGTSLARPATVTPELNALVFALRDAEVLVHGALPPACVVHRHDVW
jgi:hypothetical protein